MKAVAYFCPRKYSLVTERIHDLSRRLGRGAVNIFWKDVLPTCVILLTVGWLTLQFAAEIAQTKDNHRSASAKVSVTP